MSRNYKVQYRLNGEGGAMVVSAHDANDAIQQVRATMPSCGSRWSIRDVTVQCEAKTANGYLCQRYSHLDYCSTHTKRVALSSTT